MNELILNKQQELGFMSRTLAQISLPHSKLDTNYFERSTGLMTLSVTSNPKIGIPYGTYPRLLLAWLCTEAIRTQSPNIHLGINQTDFLKKLKLHNGGSYIHPLKDQTNRLLSSLFRLDFKDDEVKGFKNILLARGGFEFWEPRTGDWETHISLTEDFFYDVIEHPVPLDLSVLHAIRKSPMCMDVYTWLVYRAYSIYVTGNRKVKIKWRDLQLQFGANYGVNTLSTINNQIKSDVSAHSEGDQQGLRDFKKSFIYSLRKISHYHPELADLLSTDSQFLTVGGAKLVR